MRPIATPSDFQKDPLSLQRSYPKAMAKWRFTEGVSVERYSEKRAAAPEYTLSNLFLSHSSHDSHLVPSAMALLETHGANVYCDIADERLVSISPDLVGGYLREEIGRNKRLVVFRTKNTKSSRWVPWELGLADAAHGHEQVAIFPVAQDSNDNLWTEQEYFHLYRKIIPAVIAGSKMWVVWDDHTQKYEHLANWCQGRPSDPRPLPKSPGTFNPIMYRR